MFLTSCKVPVPLEITNCLESELKIVNFLQIRFFYMCYCCKQQGSIRVTPIIWNYILKLHQKTFLNKLNYVRKIIKCVITIDEFNAYQNSKGILLYQEIFLNSLYGYPLCLLINFLLSSVCFVILSRYGLRHLPCKLYAKGSEQRR